MMKVNPPTWLNSLLSSALFVLLVVISEYGIQIEKSRLKEVQRSQVLQQAATVRALLEGELNATLHITTGLTGYIAINPGLQGSKDVEKVLATLFHYGRHLRNVGLAPGNVLTHIYPLEGNEQALGLSYEKHPQQWPAVERAIASRRTVLAGPLELLQGGHGIISRTPVFLDDGRYWGLLSLVIDVDSLFSAAGLLSNSSDVEFALRGKDGLGKEGRLFLGHAKLFGQSPVLLTLSIPGGEWQLAAVPRAGWGSNLGMIEYYRAIGVLISFILAVMLWVILTEREKIKYLALHDDLTGLPNRRLFDERLNYTLIQKQRQKQPFSLLYVDLDDFKPINDQYGHKVGDMVLVETAMRMNKAVRHEDTVARIGGDEFMIILPSTGNKADTLHVANQVLEALHRPFIHQQHQLKLSVSIGISSYPQNGDTVEALIRAADSAMYRAKKEGKKRYYFGQNAT